MRWRTNISFLAASFLIVCVIQCQFAEAYKSEIEITPSPIEEPTTKKSGFFSGFKNLFRGSTTEPPKVESTTVKQPVPFSGAVKPPPLVINPNAPLQPLGPRPDTPPTSPLSGNQQQAPQWPQVPTSTVKSVNVRPVAPQQPTRPNGPLPGFGNGLATGGIHPPSKSQPSGIDLSYGGLAGKPQPGSGLGGSHLAAMTSTTTTTTTTQSPKSATMNIDLRGGDFGTSTSTTTAKPNQRKEDFPPLPPPRKSSLGHKEDFPALPTPKSPLPTSTQKSNLPSAWNSPNIPNNEKFIPVAPKLPSTSTTTPGYKGVAFVPHTGTTTVRPGFEKTGNNLATDAEIEQLTETLFTKENSFMNHIKVNVQGKTRSIDSADEAPQPLLEVDAQALNSPTISKMRLLFNNYESDTATNEHVTANERKEENDFLDAVMSTSVMRQAMLFLQNKGVVTPDPKTHRDLVKELWFTQYSRGGGKIGSSGFEHVFVHEVKNDTLIGFHNWVYFAEEEKAGRMDYKGYLKQLDLGNKGKVVKMRFSHNNLSKPVNGLFIGTSPELELALYTVCFQLRPDRTCPVSLGHSKFGVVTYSWRYRGKNLIGSAFPEI